jgi:hypothetical protein
MPPLAQVNPHRIPTAFLPYCWAQVTAELMRGPGWDPLCRSAIPTSPGVFAEPRKAAFCESVQIGDQLIRRTNPLINHQEFTAYVATLTKMHGAQLARTVFAHLRARTDSTMESWLRLVVWDAGFPDPAVNHKVSVDEQTRYLDLAWPELMIDLEFHGRQHFHEWDQAYGDVRRRGQLQLGGWTTIEATERDLTSPGKLLQRLDALFTARRGHE